MRQKKKSLTSDASKSRKKQSFHRASNQHQQSIGSVSNNKSYGSSIDGQEIPNEEDILIGKLLNLQIDLMSKINDLNTEKITVLEDYNKQFDRFTALSLEINKYPLETAQNNSQVQIKDNTLKSNQNLSKQAQLKQLLQELYQTSLQNDIQQAKLNMDQLEELSKLLNLHYQNTQKQQHIHTHLNVPIINQQTTISEQSFILKQVIQHNFPKRLSFLQSQQQLLKSFQAQSRNNVQNLMKRKASVQKEIHSIDQLLKEYEQRYQLYKSRQSIMPSSEPIPEWVKKYEKIKKYKVLKHHYNVLQKIVKQHKQADNYIKVNNRNNNKRLQYSSQQKWNKKKFQQQENDQEQEIYRLEQKINHYEQISQQQNSQKIQLFNQINQKQKQFTQIKHQNHIMLELIKLMIN